jgi:hypothetical protein
VNPVLQKDRDIVSNEHIPKNILQLLSKSIEKHTLLWRGSHGGADRMWTSLSKLLLMKALYLLIIQFLSKISYLDDAQMFTAKFKVCAESGSQPFVIE